MIFFYIYFLPKQHGIVAVSCVCRYRWSE